MEQQSSNIYQNAREAKGFTQEHSAPLLGVSVESLRSYEGGVRFPPNRVVKKMCNVYNCQYLAYEHLEQTTEDLQGILPKIDKKDLPLAVLSLVKEFREASSLLDKLVDIAADGKVTDDEVETFNLILKEFNDAKNAIATFELADINGGGKLCR